VKKLKTTIPLGAALLLVLVASLSAAVVPNGVFADHMVLQRDVPISIWGKADPGERITISLDRDIVTTVAGSDGSWRAALPAHPAAASPQSLSISGDKTPEAITLHDVLVGDVWLCSGQSNMTLYLKYLTNAPGVADDIAATYPLIRQGAVARQPSIDLVESRSVLWSPCTPQSLGICSAVGFYFARDVQQQIGVPVGILLSSFGSTSVEEWASRESLGSDPLSKKRLDQQLQHYREALDAATLQSWSSLLRKKIEAWFKVKPPLSPDKILNKTASAHYNGMIYPLGSFPIKGVIWYQGEEEALESRADDHGRQLPLLIGDWRRLWGNPQLPFIIQQLPEYKGNGIGKTEWAELREVQSLVVARTPGTYLVVGMGAGDYENLHPPGKREIGRRMALTALKEVYAENIPSSGPVYDSMTMEGNSVRIHFKNSKGLNTTDGLPPVGFFISGVDKILVPAKARIDGETVVLSSEKVMRPSAVRYAFQNAPAGLNLTNDSGLPAFPFRGGDF
jgi:sialate O-acetylesterase